MHGTIDKDGQSGKFVRAKDAGQSEGNELTVMVNGKPAAFDPNAAHYSGCCGYPAFPNARQKRGEKCGIAVRIVEVILHFHAAVKALGAYTIRVVGRHRLGVWR